MVTNNSDNTKRIAKNTIYLYGRMLLSMLISLYTSRVILQALGVDDFGIYNVVGGFVAMFAIITSSICTSISRFLTFELGAGNEDRLKRVFSTSLAIQVTMSLVLLALMETIGLWFVNYKLVIPHDRLYAANWVFQFSIFTFILSMLSSPYNASLVSHEKMGMFAYMGILGSVLNLANVLFVAYAPVPHDKLITYALITFLIAILMQGIYLIYCFSHFSESKVMPHLYKDCWKQMSGFAGWNAIGCSADVLKEQGVNVLLNLFFGPVINATRGIAGSVNNAIAGFTGNFMTAVNPQLIKSYAANDQNYTFSLINRASRFGFFIMMIFSIPVILEAPYLLHLWLGNYPPLSVVFVRLILIYSMIETISKPLITLQSATGNIRNYQIAVGGLLLMNFPVSWIVLKLGAAPSSIYWVAISIGIGCLMLRLLFLRNMVNLSIRWFFHKVILTILYTSTVAVVIPTLTYLIVPYGFISLISVGFLSIISGSLSVLYIGCSTNERQFILSKIPIVRKYYNKREVC